jgi:flagellar hook-associated protein 3
MRITNNMMSYNFLSSLNKSMEVQNNLQTQLADGIAVHKPSDDPVKATRVVRYSTSLSENGQFTQNLQDAQSWMDSTDGAMSDLSSSMIKLKGLITSADNTKTTSDINTIGKQVDEMINQIVSIGNTKVGDRYIFAGQNDTTEPFIRTTIQDPNSGKTKDVVIYNGDNSKISMPIQPGAINPGQDSINLTGVDVFGSVANGSTTTYGRQTVDVLNHLIEIKDEMVKTSTVSQTNANGGNATVGGNYTGTGYQNFDVRIDGVAAGQINAASYSIDGGNTWTQVPGANLTAGDPTVITNLGNSGVNISIGASAGNTAHTAGSTGDVYSFRVPQTAFSLNPSNAAGGAATLTGNYTGTGSTPYSVRVTSLGAGGQITGADYSIDGGSTWSSLSDYSITQSNSAGGAATMSAPPNTAPGALTAYTVHVDTVDASGKVTGASYWNGAAWTAVPVSYDVNAGESGFSSSATLQMPTGEIMHIAANANNVGGLTGGTNPPAAGDVYTVMPTAAPAVVTNAGVPAGSATAFKLPNGITLTVANSAANNVNDSFKFQFPQGSGPDTNWLSTVASQYIEDDHNLQLKAQTGLGVRMSMYEMASNMMQSENTTINSDLSHNQDIDEAKAITDFNTAKNVYNSALAVGSKIMTKSLVDFLS